MFGFIIICSVVVLFLLLLSLFTNINSGQLSNSNYDCFQDLAVSVTLEILEYDTFRNCEFTDSFQIIKQVGNIFYIIL